MTPVAFSTILLRFIALGVSVYGIFLIAKGVIIHVGTKRAGANMISLFTGQHLENLGIPIAAPLAKVVAILYMVGGSTVLVGSLLYLGSRWLGSLIARDL